MIVGDAFIGKVPGRVNMLPPDKYRDFISAKKGLEKILDFEFVLFLNISYERPIVMQGKF